MPPPSVFEDTGPPPPLWRGASTLAAVANVDQPLHGGGSFSLAAPHYCPICGIIATSEANLQVARCLDCAPWDLGTSLQPAVLRSISSYLNRQAVASPSVALPHCAEALVS